MTIRRALLGRSHTAVGGCQVAIHTATRARARRIRLWEARERRARVSGHVLGVAACAGRCARDAAFVYGRGCAPVVGHHRRWAFTRSMFALFVCGRHRRCGLSRARCSLCLCACARVTGCGRTALRPPGRRACPRGTRPVTGPGPAVGAQKRSRDYSRILLFQPHRSSARSSSSPVLVM